MGLSSHWLSKTRVYGPSARMGEVMAGWFVWLLLVSGAVAQLDLDCAAPEQARAVIDYVRLSDVEQPEDIHRAALAKALANCSEGQRRLACRAEQQRQADID